MGIRRRLIGVFSCPLWAAMAIGAEALIVRLPEGRALRPPPVTRPDVVEVFAYELNRGLPRDFPLFARAKYPALFATNQEEAIARARKDLEVAGVGGPARKRRSSRSTTR